MSESTNNSKAFMRRREVVSLKIEEVKSKKRIMGNISQIGIKNETDMNEGHESNMQQIWNIFSKKERRNLTDNQTIINYLQTMTEFVDLIKRSLNNDYRMVIELLTQISFYLDHEKHEKNKMLFRLGDRGDKFYIILKGSVDVLIPKNKKVKITEMDYLFYLSTLHQNNELDLLKMCLQDNMLNYKLDFTQIITNKPIANENYLTLNPKKNSLIRMSTFNRKIDVLNDEIRRRFTNLVDLEKKRKSVFNIEKLTKLEEKDEEDDESSFGSFGKKRNIMNNSCSSQSSYTSNDSAESRHKENFLNLNYMKKSVFNMKNQEKNSTKNFSSEEYINRLKVYKEIKSDEVTYPNKIIEVIVYDYTVVASLSTGNKFGDVALNSQTKKRSATIITKEDSHFATLDKEYYLKCILESNEKVKKMNLNFLLGTSLLKNINRDFFDKKYYNYFNYVSYDRKFKLFSENEEVKKIFFLKEGEYDVTMNRSLTEVSEIIKYFGRNYESLNLINSDFDKNEKYLFNTNPFFKKFYSTKRPIRIRIIKGKDILGLEDVLFNGKCLFNIEGISIHSELFSIDKKLFEDIHDNVYEVTENAELFIKMKINLLVEKLKAIREVKIKSFLKSSFNENTMHKEIDSDQPKTNLNLNKERNSKMFEKFDLKIGEKFKFHFLKNEANYKTVMSSIYYNEGENKIDEEKTKSASKDFSVNPIKFPMSRKLNKPDKNKERSMNESLKEFEQVRTKQSVDKFSDKRELNNGLPTSPSNEITKSKINFSFKKKYENKNVHINTSALKDFLLSSTQTSKGYNTVRTENSNLLSKFKERKEEIEDKCKLLTNNTKFSNGFHSSGITSTSFNKTIPGRYKNKINCINIDQNFIETSAKNFFIEPPSRNYTTIKEMQKIEFNLNQFHFLDHPLTDRGIIQTDNGLITSTFITHSTNEITKTRNHSQTASNIMNNRAKIFYSPIKMKFLKQNRYSNDLDIMTLDAYELQERKRQKIIKEKESVKLIRAKHNLFRFCKKIRIKDES